MRMSCNGCRVLRKGCSESCSIRPCLQWIKRPESQANATVFLAKFYGRAGLLNLINAGPDHLRPAIFRSLMYEACGRILNPIFGSVGLLWSGSWGLCQAAVESVLKGDPIETIPSDAAASIPAPPFKAHDIRHISREPCRRIGKCRPRFKRSGATPKARSSPEISGRHWCYESTENESMLSADTAEASHVSQGESHSDASEVCLDLSLGLSQSTSLDPGGHGVDLHLQLPP